MGERGVSEMAFHSGNTVKKQGGGAWSCHLGKKGSANWEGLEELEKNC